MAYFDLEEQEQISAIKAWWRQYGRLVLGLAAAVVLSIAAVQGWRYYHDRQAAQASELYHALEQAVEKSDTAAAQESAARLMEQYPSTAYASMAALLAARLSFEADDAKSAEARLRWVLERDRDPETTDFARLRLAGLLLDQKRYPEALTLLEQKHGEAFAGRYADLKGDILFAQGNVAEARAAYRVALERIESNNPLRGLVEMKLDALGEAS